MSRKQSLLTSTEDLALLSEQPLTVDEPPRTEKTVLKNLFFQTLNVSSTFLLLSIGSIVTARVLGVEKMGQYGLLTTFSSTVINVGTLGLVDAASRFVAQFAAQGDRRKVLGFVRFGILTELIISLMAAVLIFWFALPLSQAFSLSGHEFYFLLTAVLVAPAMLSSMFTSTLAGLQRYDLISLVKIITNLPLLLLTIAVLVFQLNIVGLLVVNIVVNFAALLIYATLVARQLPLFEKARFSGRSNIVPVLKYSFSMMMLTLLNIVVWQRSEVFLLSSYRPAREVGIYITAFILSSVFNTLITNILHVLIPTLAQLMGQGDLAGVSLLFRRTARLTALIAVPISFGGILLAEEALGLLYGGQYLDGVPALRILMLATLSGTIAASASYTAVSITSRSGPFVYLMLGLALLSLGLDFALIPPFGVVGAAVANTLVQLLAPFAFNQFLKHFHGFGYPTGNIALIIGTGLVSLLCAEGFQLLLGGLSGTVGAALLFTVLFLVGVVAVKAIYQEDVDTLIKMVSRLPKGLNRPLVKWLSDLKKGLQPELNPKI